VHENHPDEIIMAAVPITSTWVNDYLTEQHTRTHNYTVLTRPAFKRPAHSPFEGGPRLALLYLAFEALRAYGVLDDKVRRHMHKITRVQTLILHDASTSDLPGREKLSSRQRPRWQGTRDYPRPREPLNPSHVWLENDHRSKAYATRQSAAGCSNVLRSGACL
jgi:hypothetical protein